MARPAPAEAPVMTTDSGAVAMAPFRVGGLIQRLWRVPAISCAGTPDVRTRSSMPIAPNWTRPAACSVARRKGCNSAARTVPDNDTPGARICSQMAFEISCMNAMFDRPSRTLSWWFDAKSGHGFSFPVNGWRDETVCFACCDGKGVAALRSARGEAVRRRDNGAGPQAIS